MKMKKKYDWQEHEGLLTFGFLLAAILIVILSQFSYEAELPPVLSFALFWIPPCLLIEAVTGTAAFLIRCFTERFSRDVLMLVMDALAAAAVAYYAMRNAHCGGIPDSAAILMPPLMFLILLHLILWIGKGVSAIRAKKTEESVPAK